MTEDKPYSNGKQTLCIQDYTQEIPKTPEQVVMAQFVELLRTGAPIPYELLLRVQEIVDRHVTPPSRAITPPSRLPRM